MPDFMGDFACHLPFSRFFRVETVFHVFAGPFGTFLDAPCCSRQRRPCWLCHSSPPILTPRMRSAARPKSSQKKTTTVGVSQSLFQKAPHSDRVQPKEKPKRTATPCSPSAWVTTPRAPCSRAEKPSPPTPAAIGKRSQSWRTAKARPGLLPCDSEASKRRPSKLLISPRALKTSREP